MTKPLPRIVIEGERGRVEVRLTGKGGYRIKATRFDGDAVEEMALAARTASLMQTVLRHVTKDATFKLKAGPIRHIEDHGA